MLTKNNALTTRYNILVGSLMIKYHRKTNIRQLVPNTMLQNRPQACARSIIRTNRQPRSQMMIPREMLRAHERERGLGVNRAY
jgi:hypothetical protein